MSDYKFIPNEGGPRAIVYGINLNSPNQPQPTSDVRELAEKIYSSIDYYFVDGLRGGTEKQILNNLTALITAHDKDTDETINDLHSLLKDKENIIKAKDERIAELEKLLRAWIEPCDCQPPCNCQGNLIDDAKTALDGKEESDGK